MRRPVLPLLAVVSLVAGCAGLKPMGPSGGLQVLQVAPTGASGVAAGPAGMAPNGAPAGPTGAVGNGASSGSTLASAPGAVSGGSRGSGGGSSSGRQSRASGGGAAGGGATAAASPVDRLVSNFSLTQNPRLEPSRKSFEAVGEGLVKAGLISNNGGGVIGNNGSNLISNNGGGMMTYRMVDTTRPYRVAGTAPVGELQLYWDSRTGEISKLVGSWGQLALKMLGAGDTRTIEGKLTGGPDGATGQASVAIQGTWQTLPQIWASLLQSVTTQKCYLGGGVLPMTISGISADVALTPKGDPALAMTGALTLDFGVKPNGLTNLSQPPSRIAIALRFPGMTFEWESVPADPEATGVDALEGGSRGALTVDTEDGPDRLDYALESEVDPVTGETSLDLNLSNETSGLGMDPSHRAGEKSLARLETLEAGDGVGMVAVGESEVSPLQVRYEDGSTKPWEIFPVEWLAYLPALPIPEGLFPVATPAPAPSAMPPATPPAL